MSAPACMVITAHEWAAIVHAFLWMAAITVWLSVRWLDWYEMIERRVRRTLRRRRIAAIRAVRA